MNGSDHRKLRITGTEWRRVALYEGDQDISHLGYAPMPMCMGPVARLRMAGIGGVGTDPAYRRQGLARQVFARSLEEMRTEGYASVGLYTGTQIVAHRLYRQFGFVDILPGQAAAKLLDPAQFVRTSFADLLRGDDLPEEVARLACACGGPSPRSPAHLPAYQPSGSGSPLFSSCSRRPHRLPLLGHVHQSRLGLPHPRRRGGGATGLLARQRLSLAPAPRPLPLSA